MAELEVSPCVVVPSRSFLVGALYGMNAARKRLEDNPQALVGNEEITGDIDDKLYLGHWLELHCGKCGALYTFDDANHIPATNLICSLRNCGNHIIVYGISDPKVWRIGEMTFV